MRPNLCEIDETVDLAQEMIAGNMALQAEAVEQHLLHRTLLAHHGVSPRFIEDDRISSPVPPQAESEFFNAIRPSEKFVVE